MALYISAVVLLGLGWLVMLVGGVRLLIAAFRIHVGWGLAVLFLPPASLVFLFLHWPEAKSPFLNQILGLLIFFVGAGIGSFGLSKDSGMMLAMLEDMPLPTEFRHGSYDPWDTGEPVGVDSSSGRESLGISGALPLEIIGWPIEDVRMFFGRPLGESQTGQRRVLVYERFLVVCDNGEEVSAVRSRSAH